MIIMLDQSVGKIYELQINNPTVEIQQFRTPLTQYKSGNIPYILDNGAYSGFNEKKFLRMANASKNDIFCKYIVMPDVVGDAQSTYNQFRYYKNIIGLRPNQTAFVLQDGAERRNMPDWDEFDCLFIGGSTEFKMSGKAYIIAQEAIAQGKHVHVGRVNTPSRIVKWHGNCHSIDGSGISKYDHMFDKAVDLIIELNEIRQSKLYEFV